MTAANRDSAAVATAPPESSTSDRELVATRVFDAPRGLVFKLWTDPEHIGRWWGPRGFTTTTASMDFRPGGAWRYCMHGPDGTDYQNRITYTEIVEPERIAFKHGGERDVEPVGHEVTATFEEVGGKTRVTMRLLFPTAEQRDYIVEKYGAAEGLVETIDRLTEVATEEAGTRTNALTVSMPSDLEFRLTRTFDRPVRRLGGDHEDRARRPLVRPPRLDPHPLRAGPPARRRLADRPPHARRQGEPVQGGLPRDRPSRARGPDLHL